MLQPYRGMKGKLVKLVNLSGSKASIYSVIIPGESVTLYERFIQENASSFKSELKDINDRLKAIGKTVGAREQYFKLDEGIPGDGVCALYDDPDKRLRLYCIRYGTQLVILGGGGPKPKCIRALQEDPKLTEENYYLRELSDKITERLKEKDILFSKSGLDFEGDLEFNDEDDE